MENQSVSKILPAPLLPLASVYTWTVEQLGERKWTPFQDGEYVIHQSRSWHAVREIRWWEKSDLNVDEKWNSNWIKAREKGMTCEQNWRYPVSSCNSCQVQCVFDLHWERRSERYLSFKVSKWASMAWELSSIPRNSRQVIGPSALESWKRSPRDFESEWVHSRAAWTSLRGIWGAKIWRKSSR